MTNSTLEKVARALGEADGVVWTEGYVQYRANDCPADETTPERYARRARAALQSLRQVDDETVEAMARAACPKAWRERPTDAGPHWEGNVAQERTAAIAVAARAFTAAIDHILGQEP